MTAFEHFFAVEFQRMQKSVVGEPGLFSNGSDIQDASWDRKAAYHLWVAMGRPNANDAPAPSATDLDDLLG